MPDFLEHRWGKVQGEVVATDSVAGFATVADGQNHDLLSVVTVEGDIRALAEFDDPLAEFGREVFDGTTDLWVLAENFHALADRFDGTAGGVGAFGSEKLMEAGYVPQGGWGPDQM